MTIFFSNLRPVYQAKFIRLAFWVQPDCPPLIRFDQTLTQDFFDLWFVSPEHLDLLWWLHTNKTHFFFLRQLLQFNGGGVQVFWFPCKIQGVNLVNIFQPHFYSVFRHSNLDRNFFSNLFVDQNIFFVLILNFWQGKMKFLD